MRISTKVETHTFKNTVVRLDDEKRGLEEGGMGYGRSLVVAESLTVTIFPKKRWRFHDWMK